MYLWASSKTTSLLKDSPSSRRLGEHLEEHDEEAERLVLLDELVAQVDDDEATRAEHVRQPASCRRCTPRQIEA